MLFFSKLFKNMYKSLTGEDLIEIRKKDKSKNLELKSQSLNGKNIFKFKENFKNLPWETYESIYSYILSNCHLDSFSNGDFPLLEDKNKKEEDKWGVIELHQKEIIENVDELLVDSISTNLINCCNYPIEKNMINFYNSLISTNIILVMDLIIENVVARQEEFSIENLYLIGVWLCRDTCHRSAVIFGIALLGRIRLEDDIIDVLSKSNDFIFPLGIAIINEGRNVTEKLMRLAEGINGWYKIQILEYIKPNTFNDKKWFLTKGLKCNIKSAKFAKICSEKSDLYNNIDEYLKLSNTRSSITKIINYFLDEEDYYEFYSYDFNKGLIQRYIEYLSNNKLYKDEKLAFKRIYRFASQQRNDSDLAIIAEIIREKLNVSV